MHAKPYIVLVLAKKLARSDLILLYASPSRPLCDKISPLCVTLSAVCYGAAIHTPSSRATTAAVAHLLNTTSYASVAPSPVISIVQLALNL